MYTKTTKIEKEIKGYFIDENRIFLWTGINNYKDRKLICWDNGLEEIIRTPEALYLQYIRNSNNYYWANFLEKTGSFKINKNDFSIKETPIFFIQEDGDNIFIMLREEKKHLCYYDELNDKILWKQDFSSARLLVMEKYMFCMPGFAYQANHLLYCINKESGELLWKYEEDIGMPLEELDRILPPKIRRIIGIFNEELILGLTENDFIALDIHTGVLKYKWEDIKGVEMFRGKEIERPFHSSSVLLDEDNGKLIGIIFNIHWEIDLKTRAVTYWDISKVLEKYSIRFRIKKQTIKKGDHIFFQSEKSVDGRHLGYKIGAYNCTTREVDWLYDFHPEGVDLWGSPEIKVNEEKLYVLDHSGTLHIFEKTS